MMSSQSRLLFIHSQHRTPMEGSMQGSTTYFSVNVLWSSHVIMGKFRRSLYVGRRTEYLSCFCLGGILTAGSLQMGE